jgi:hypothetical protein
MYRGSSFLLQRSYTIHVAVVERLAAPELAALWHTEVGTNASDAALVPTILFAVDAVREAYAPFGAATDTLVTKVILGTLGCLPAVDRFFIDGFKKSGNKVLVLERPFCEASDLVLLGLRQRLAGGARSDSESLGNSISADEVGGHVLLGDWLRGGAGSRRRR